MITIGHWSMHIEGTGIHDNGRDDDAEVMLREFAGSLAQHHVVHSATFTVGSTRELANANEDGAVELAEAAPLAREGRHAYRSR